MKEPKASLARYVAVDLSDARVARVWEGVSSELLRRPRARVGWVASAATAVVIALLGAGWHHVRARTSESLGVAEESVATASEARTVHLDAGLRVELSAHTRVRLERSAASGVRLHMQHGRVTCDVTRDAARRFVVSAAGVDVVATETRFSVELAPRVERVAVEVDRGTVVVHGAGQPRRLTEGESWSFEEDLGKSAALQASQEDGATAGSNEPEVGVTP
ncbi:MAG TPA: FecR domain-containing protein [Polyangiaceae bacterium]